MIKIFFIQIPPNTKLKGNLFYTMTSFSSIPSFIDPSTFRNEDMLLSSRSFILPQHHQHSREIIITENDRKQPINKEYKREIPRPTSFRIMPQFFFKEESNQDEIKIVSYKFTQYDGTSLIASLDDLCNLRLIDMNSRNMKIFAIGVVNPIGTLDELGRMDGVGESWDQNLSSSLQKVMIRPFTDWTLYGKSKLLLVQKFDNKVHYANLDGILDLDDDVPLDEVLETYASRNLIQIASHEAPISCISMQMRREDIDPSSIRDQKIQSYLLVTGTDYGECKVWNVKEGDPPHVECIFSIQPFKNRITSVSTYVYSFMNTEKIIAYASALNQELKAFDVLKSEWLTERPIELSPVNVMKIFSLRTGEHILATANSAGTIQLYISRNLSLYRSIYVNLNANQYQVKDICIFVDPISKKDVVVIPCNSTSEKNHVLRFYIDGALIQEYTFPHPILFCTVFNNLQQNEEHLVVGNNSGLIDAWNIKDIISHSDNKDSNNDIHDDILEHSSLDHSDTDSEAEIKKYIDDASVQDESSTLEPDSCPSPKIMPRSNQIPQPMRDSRIVSQTESKDDFEQSFTMPRKQIPVMQRKDFILPERQSSPNIFKGRNVQFDLPPQTPRERDSIPIQTSKQYESDSTFLMPLTTVKREKKFQHPEYPQQPKEPIVKKPKKFRPSVSPSKRIHYKNPKEFMNILEQQALELESPENFPDHPLSKPQAHSTRLLERKIMELENEEFDPERYMKEKNLLVDRDATIHAYEFQQEKTLYNNLPSIHSPKDISRTKKRLVSKQVSEAYLEEQRISAPQFDQIMFYDELQEEVKYDIEDGLFTSRIQQKWKDNALVKKDEYREEDIESNPLGTPVSHHIAHRFVAQFQKNPHWFHE